MFVLIIAVTALWVYMDSTKIGIGRQPNASGLFNISGGAWATCTLMLWIIAFPAYLIKRPALKVIASENPIRVRMRGFKAFIIAVIGFGWFVAVMYADYLERMGQL